jgi:predicted restriction endonuclease
MSDDWYSIRRQVFERDHYACKRCGKLEKECHRSLDVHHIIPAGKGGLDELGNLIALCPVCHPAEKSKSRPHIQMVERTFHIPIDIDDELRMMTVKDHLRFSEMATLAFKGYISRRQKGAS